MENKRQENLENKLKALKSLSLKDEEKSSIKSNLLVFMDEFVRKEEAARPSFRSQLLTLVNLRFMPLVLSLMLFVSGGVAFAAEGTMPGDILYPVKSLNEKARIALAFSEESKAEFESRFAVRRLEEAERLIAEGSLDAEQKTALEANFEKHADSVNKHVKKIKERDLEVAATISSDFESALKVHGQVLADLLDKKGSNDEALISTKVRVKGDVFTDVRRGIQSQISAEANADLEVSVGNKLEAVAHKIEEVKNFIEAKEDKVSAEVMAEAEARLQESEDKLIEAKAKIEAKAYAEAFNDLQDAMRIAQEAKLLVEVSSNFKARVRNRDESEYHEESRLPGNIEPDKEHHVEVDARTRFDAEANRRRLDAESELRTRVNIGL